MRQRCHRPDLRVAVHQRTRRAGEPETRGYPSSGGIQEEANALGVPCITLRNNTERPITAAEGTNVVLSQDSQRILASVNDVLQTGGKAGRIPEFWDGNAAERIASVLREVYAKANERRAQARRAQAMAE